MKSVKHGKPTLGADSIHITSFGLWLLLDDREYYADFTNFPWFKEAKVADVFQVQQLHPGHLYWPALDVDLSLESLESPEKFPLVAKSKKKKSK